MVFQDPRTDFVNITLLILRRSIDCNSLAFIDNMTQKIRLKNVEKFLKHFNFLEIFVQKILPTTLLKGYSWLRMVNLPWKQISTMMRKLFDKNFAPLAQVFLDGGAKMSFFFSIFSFFFKCRQKFSRDQGKLQNFFQIF